MKINIKRIDNTLPLPAYQTKGAVAFDIYSRTDIEVAPKSLARIPTNLIIEVPAGYMLAVIPRSSTAQKMGLSIPHGIGVIDQDYHGPSDEILYQVYNFTDTTASIKRGDRIGQACFLRVDQMEWNEVDDVTSANRGGFGSTGT